MVLDLASHIIHTHTHAVSSTIFNEDTYIIKLSYIYINIYIPCRMSSFFKYKDGVPAQFYVTGYINLNVVIVIAIGKAPRHYIVRTSEHLIISCLTGDPVDRKSQNKSAVEKHIAEKEHLNNICSFSIIAFAPYSKYLFSKYLLRDMILT